VRLFNPALNLRFVDSGTLCINCSFRETSHAGRAGALPCRDVCRRVTRPKRRYANTPIRFPHGPSGIVTASYIPESNCHLTGARAEIAKAICMPPEFKTQKNPKSMPAVATAAHKKGDFFVDYEEKVFEDVKAIPGEKALVTFHTVAFEGSIGLVNTLSATRLLRKGFETSILLYGPGVTLGVQRGFPTLGDEAFPGHLAVNQRMIKFMDEGGKIYACRFALQALYGHGEPALIPGIKAISPLDVLDLILIHRREGAFILDTWTL
jgi:uncharacterized repeat protein (TIGR04044 family)